MRRLFGGNSVIPRPDDTPGGSNGADVRTYAHGDGIPVRQPVELAYYLHATRTNATDSTELVPVSHAYGYRPARFLLQAHTGGAAGSRDGYLRESFTGRHGEVVRKGAGRGHGDAASAVSVVSMREKGSRFLRDTRRAAPKTSREGTTFGTAGQELAPVGTPQLRPYPGLRVERSRTPGASRWNGGR